MANKSHVPFAERLASRIHPYGASLNLNKFEFNERV
jgi:hypothetical protein